MSNTAIQAVLKHVGECHPTAVPQLLNILTGAVQWEDFVNGLPIDPVSDVQYVSHSSRADIVI